MHALGSNSATGRDASRLALALVCLSSWVALAQESELSDISLKYESQLVEEVVVTAEKNWRNRPSAEAEWRRELKEYELKDGRFDVAFGYDSVYEEMRAKQYRAFEELGSSDIKPVSLIRIAF